MKHKQEFKQTTQRCTKAVTRRTISFRQPLRTEYSALNQIENAKCCKMRLGVIRINK